MLTLRDAITKRVQGEKHRDPAWDIRNSLIVLPEAFNLGEYDPRSKPGQPLPQFLDDLRAIAAEHAVMFVTGVVENRRNSAYLIDGQCAQLMCYKIGEDDTKIYDPCTGDPDPFNPIAFSNACVGALICLDAAADQSFQPCLKKRLDRFWKRLRAHEAKRKIICVPGRFLYPRRSLLVGLSLTEDCWYIVAQGHYELVGHGGSFIADSAHIRKAEVEIEARGFSTVKLWQFK
ncbi:MAG: hypothetical protein ACLQU1_00465 [Bryobacteraceae bacterium]